MKRNKSICFSIIAILLGISLNVWAAEINANNISELIKNEGEFVTVTGIVESTYIPKSGKVRFLNLGPDYRTAFTVVIFTGDLDKFTSKIGEPTEYYKNKKIAVKGRIKLYQGKPEIIANSPDQISILSTKTSVSDENPNELLCFLKSELQGGVDLWKGNEEKKCVQRKFVYCYVDNSVSYPPLICIDKRDGSFLSFTD